MTAPGARRWRRSRAAAAAAIPLAALGALISHPGAAAAADWRAAGALAASWPALAQPAPGGTGPDDGVGPAAGALLASPLYVDPDMAWLFTARATGRIERALRASPVRVFIAAVPLNIDNDNDDYAGYFLDQLYHRLHVAGVYLAVTPSGSIYDAEYLVPRDISLPLSVEEEQASPFSPAPIAANTPGRILTLLHLIATSPADPQAAASPTPFPLPGAFADGGSSSSSSSSSPSAAAQIATAGATGFWLFGPLLALAGLAIARAGRGLVAARRGAGDAGEPGRPAGRMPASPSADWLRRHARGELAALARLIGAGDDTNPGWQRACDDYDAGMLVCTPQAEQVDLVGAIVLARDGRVARDWRTARPPPPCLLNPLHGRSVGLLPDSRAVGLALGPLISRMPMGEVPACPRCLRIARRSGPARAGSLVRLTARQLRVEHDGRRLHYFEFDSVWRDVRFGASGPALPQAVRERLGVS